MKETKAIARKKWEGLEEELFTARNKLETIWHEAGGSCSFCRRFHTKTGCGECPIIINDYKCMNAPHPCAHFCSMVGRAMNSIDDAMSDAKRIIEIIDRVKEIDNA